MSGTPGRPGSWGSRPDLVIAQAKAAAKRALRKKRPQLTALERAFYEKYKQERLDEARLLIQLKTKRRSQNKAA